MAISRTNFPMGPPTSSTGLTFTAAVYDMPHIMVVQDNQLANEFKKKFVLSLYINHINPFLNATPIIVKVSPNENMVGIFDIQDILRAYVSPQYIGTSTLSGSLYSTKRGGSPMDYRVAQTFHSVHEIDAATPCVDETTLNRYMFTVHTESASNYNDTPTEDTTNMTGCDDVTFMNAVRKDTHPIMTSASGASVRWAYGGLKGECKPANIGNGLTFLTDTFTIKNYRSPRGYLYTTHNRYHSIVNDSYDYHTVSCFSGIGDSGTNTEVNEMEVVWGNSFGILQTDTISMTNTDSYDAQFGSDTKQELKHYGVGPGNILADGGVTEPAGWEQYTVRLMRSGVPYSGYYTFEKRLCTAQDYEYVRLGWLNSYGTWDYMAFPLKSEISTKTKKKNYTKPRGNWQAVNNSQYHHNTNHSTHSQRVFHAESKQSLVINTDWLHDKDREMVERLLISPDVIMVNKKYMGKEYDSTADLNASATDFYTQINDPKIRPVLVTSSKLKRKTKANDTLFQYQIEIEYSKPMTSQGG